MLTRSLSCGALPRMALRAFSTTPKVASKWGNLPSKDEPRDPRKHCYDRDPIPRPTTDKLLQELNEKRWNMLRLSKQAQGAKQSK